MSADAHAPVEAHAGQCENRESPPGRTPIQQGIPHHTIRALSSYSYTGESASCAKWIVAMSRRFPNVHFAGITTISALYLWAYSSLSFLTP